MLNSQEATPRLSRQQSPLDLADVETEGALMWLCSAPHVGPDPLFSQRFSPTRQMRQSQTPGSFEHFAERQDFVTVLGLVQDKQGQGSLSTVVCRFGKRIQRGAYASVERAQDLELGGPGFRSRPCLSPRSLRKKKVLVMGIHFRDVLRIR